MHQDFNIASRPKPVPQAFQFSPQNMVVVNLPIADREDSGVLIINGLLTTRYVDDAQTSHSESYAVAYVIPLVIRSPMHDGIAHCTEAHYRIFISHLTANEPGYAAHSRDLARGGAEGSADIVMQMASHSTGCRNVK